MTFMFLLNFMNILLQPFETYIYSFFTILNSDEINILLQTSLSTPLIISLGRLPRSGLCWVKGHSSVFQHQKHMRICKGLLVVIENNSEGILLWAFLLNGP